MRRILVEAAVESIAAVESAELHGAHRLELCGDLDSGGVTPARSLLEESLRRTGLPVHVMIRPRPGNFVYTQSEVDRMCDAVSRARAVGAAGFVTGALRKDRSLDTEAVARLVAAAGSLVVVFHRAFDELARPLDALEKLIDLGIGGVLTAGGSATAAQGIPRIREVVDLARGRIEIIAGGGVSEANVAQIVRHAGVPAVHARCEADGGRILGITRALSAV